MEDSITFDREDQLQAYCYKWFWNEYRFSDWRRMLFHVDNNSFNAVTGARKKALGVVRGPSDFVLVSFEMWFIEIKLPGEKQADEQLEFMMHVMARGHNYVICYSFIQFKNLIWQIIGKS